MRLKSEGRKRPEPSPTLRFDSGFGLRISGFGFIIAPALCRRLPAHCLARRLGTILFRRSGGGYETGEVLFRFLQVGEVKVHHVTGGVSIESDILHQGGIDIEVIERVA